jgi:hypothetical protein
MTLDAIDHTWIVARGLLRNTCIVPFCPLILTLITEYPGRSTPLPKVDK